MSSALVLVTYKQYKTDEFSISIFTPLIEKPIPARHVYETLALSWKAQIWPDLGTTLVPLRSIGNEEQVH